MSEAFIPQPMVPNTAASRERRAILGLKRGADGD